MVPQTVGAAQIRMLLVDDNHRFRVALEEHLRQEPRIEIVGRASNGAEAVALVAELRPDVVTMDLDMPVMDGIEATSAILAVYPETHVIVVSGSSFAGDRSQATELGIAAAIPKSRVYADLIDTVLALDTRRE